MPIDALVYIACFILTQHGDGNMVFPICYVSKQLSSAEKNYTTTQREQLGMVYVVDKFHQYLYDGYNFS